MSPHVNIEFKRMVNFIPGDFLLSKALINMIRIKDFDALERISITAEKLSAGEILQIEKSLSGSMTEDIYYDMIYQKTASLISTCCELGAITSTGKDKDRMAMINYGTKLGMAFQIKDDLFDILGNENSTGKKIGADVKRNMITLPLIYAYQKINKSENRKIKSILSQKKKTKTDLNDLKEIIDRVGGFTYALQKISEFNDQAINALSPYPDSPYKKSMVDLVSFNTQRKG